MDRMRSNRTSHFPTYTVYTLSIGINSSLLFFCGLSCPTPHTDTRRVISVFLVEQLKVSYHLVACSVNSHKRDI